MCQARFSVACLLCRGFEIFGGGLIGEAPKDICLNMIKQI